MPADKEFNTVYNQIRLLKERGLKINDVHSVKDHLLEKNYFNLINGFETLLLDDSKIQPKKYTNKSFDDFLNLHGFDRTFSSMVFQKISELETKLKTAIAYHFSRCHGASLSDNNNYINLKYYDTPQITEAPKKYIHFFRKHKLFFRDYTYYGKFRGQFEGRIIDRGNKTLLEGVFKGRFGSTSIRYVKGKCLFINSKQQVNLSLLRNAPTENDGSKKVSIELKKPEEIKGLNYIDYCKIQFPYINEYNNPPFWVTIKTLMLNDIITLIYGLKKRTFDSVLKEFNLKPNDKESFINSLEIIRDLRNACAHFELINRFRTPQNLRINNHLINELQLTPIRNQHIIKLYDVLKVLNVYIDLTEIKLFLKDYWDKETVNGNTDTVISLFDRMGNSNINDWVQM